MAARPGTARKDAFDRPAKYVSDYKWTTGPDPALVAAFERKMRESVKSPPYWAKYLSEPPPVPVTELHFVGGPWDDVTKIQAVSASLVTFHVPVMDPVTGRAETHEYQRSDETGEWLWIGCR